MSFFKYLVLALFAASCSISSAFAKENVSKEKPKSVEKTATAEKSYPKYVNYTISIDVGDRDIVVGEDGQALSRFKYTITNKSEFPIQNIQWMSVYVHNRQVVHSQDMQIELENTLLPGKTLTINLQIPFTQIDEKYRSIFMNTQEPIHVYKIERSVMFKDKKVVSDN